MPMSVDRLTILAALLAALAVVSLVSGVARMAFQRRIQLVGPCGGLALMLAALTLLAVAGWTQTYCGLHGIQIVATVHAAPVPGSPQAMQVVFTPVTDGKPGRAQTYYVRGDEWQLGAQIVAWQDWLNILGLHASYRITSLTGYYVEARGRAGQQVTTYDLGSAHGTMSRLLHDHPDLMPFARIAAGNAVRMLPGPATYNVYLSASGSWAAQS